MKFHWLLMSLLTGLFLQAQNQSISVIGNPKGTPAELTPTKLQSIFLGEIKTWDNGNTIFLALMKSNTDPGKLTCEKVYQMTCDEVTKFWLGKAMESKTATPSFFNTVNDLQAYVAGKPGAIGIIDGSPPAPGVRVILIDRKKSF